MTKSCLWAFTMVALCAPAPAAIFTFEDVANFTTTPFSVESGTTTANFASPQGSVFFVATTSEFSSLTGKVLVDDDAASNELRILFSERIQTISLLFALNTPLIADSLSLSAFLDGTAVGSTSATGTVPGGFTFPEGSLSFSGSVFDEVRLTSNALDFGIDNVDVTPVPVPEPSSLLLAGGGVAVLLIRQKKRR
jgi:PEP-CTERM motif-containing protein